jgi:hypothetical protein
VFLNPLLSTRSPPLFINDQHTLSITCISFFLSFFIHKSIFRRVRYNRETPGTVRNLTFHLNPYTGQEDHLPHLRSLDISYFLFRPIKIWPMFTFYLIVAIDC